MKYLVKEDGELVGVFGNAPQAIALNDSYIAYGRNTTIDILTDSEYENYLNESAEAEETEPEGENETEENTMMNNYNYLEAVREDVREYIDSEITRGEYTDREELEERLDDELWTADSVTGNASGSYTFNRYKAREYVLAGGMEMLTEAEAEGYIKAATIGRKICDEDWETLDVIIRCYCLYTAVSEVLDELEESGYFDEPETDDSDIYAAEAAEIETA